MEKDNYITVNQSQEDISSDIDFRHIAEISPDIIAVYDINFRYLYVNPIIFSIIGISRDDCIGKSDRELGLSEEYVEYIETMIRNVFRTGDNLKIEYSYPTGVGLLWFSSHLFPDFDEKKNIRSVISITRDISDLKTSSDVSRIKQDVLEEKIYKNTKEIAKMNKQLEEESVEQKKYHDAFNSSETKYKQLVDLMQEGIWVVDCKGTTTYANPRMAQILGYLDIEMTDESIFTFIAEKDLELTKSHLARIIEGFADKFEMEFVQKDGNSITLLIDAHPVYNAIDQIIGVIQCVIDMTNLHYAEDQIRTKEDQIEAIFNQNLIGIAFNTIVGDFIRVNKRYCKIMGYTEEELLQMNLMDITVPDYRSQTRDNMAKLITGEIQVYKLKKQYRRKDNTMIWGLVTGSLVRDTHGNPKYIIALLEAKIPSDSNDSD
jgi:PAS domain S-box-containing protein